MYRRLYPEWFDRLSLQPQYRVPDFTKFFDSDNFSTVQHVGRYLVQCAEISMHASLMFRLFPVLLSRSALA
jgi:hypothetical protein